MSNASLPVYDAAGNLVGNLQTYRNTVGGTAVDSEAVTLTDSGGNEKIGQQASASSIPVVLASDQSVPVRPVIKGTYTASASGANTVYTPTSGKSVRLLYFGYSASGSVSGCLVQMALAGYNGGSAFDAQYMATAGQPFARDLAAGHDYIQGSVNGALSVTLSAAQTVYVNYELVEV